MLFAGDQNRASESQMMLPFQVTCPDRQVIRFALGYGAEPCSHLWRLWTRGDEVYMAVRDSVRMTKFSLHSNGNWQFRAGTLVRILLPRRPYSLGWDRGPTIDFPVLADFSGFPQLIERPRAQFLIPPSPVGIKIAFCVHYAIGVPDNSSVTKDFPAAAGIAGPLCLRTAHSVWLVATAITMAPAELTGMREQLAGIRVNMSGRPDGTERGWILDIVDVAPVGTVIRNYALRRGNFVESAPSSD